MEITTIVWMFVIGISVAMCVSNYNSRFLGRLVRKLLEIDGWQIEYRTEPGKDVVTKKLANGVKPEAGKKYYIAADAKQSDGSFVSHYLYDNGSALKTATSVNGNSYLWTCIVNDDNTYSFQNERKLNKIIVIIDGFAIGKMIFHIVVPYPAPSI